ncbi:MAG: DUF4276 family protein [Chloroflexi bacterium]|nr:DUF4276 family protein [Chloroflexota bacterium]
MSSLRFTLLGEGPTDDALLPIIMWVLQRPSLGLLPDVDVVGQFVSSTAFRFAAGLTERVVTIANQYPTDLLVVHRDADSPSARLSRQDVMSSIEAAQEQLANLPPVIPVVPIREMEAWLLTDEAAIRSAARNPRGRVRLNLPRESAIEACPDPKAALREALRLASNLPRRRWSEIDRIRPRNVADLSETFEPLRQLPAFRSFEADVQRVIQEQGWPERLPA